MNNKQLTDSRSSEELKKHSRLPDYLKMKEIVGLSSSELRSQLMEDLATQDIFRAASGYVHEATIVPTITGVTFSVASTSAACYVTTCSSGGVYSFGNQPIMVSSASQLT